MMQSRYPKDREKTPERDWKDTKPEDRIPRMLDIVKKACTKRGVAGIKMLGRTFKIFDDDGNRRLSKEEFKWGLRDYGIVSDPKSGLTDSEIMELFNALDLDHTGSLSFDEFLNRFQPPMPKDRIKLVQKVFDYLANKNDDGKDTKDVITWLDMEATYSVEKHPKFLSGEWTKKKCIQEFMHTFEPDEKRRDGLITREEFLLYYDGVSDSIDRDVYFDFMMRQAWPRVFTDTSDRYYKDRNGVGQVYM